MGQIFLLSPARTSGPRAAALLREPPRSPTARRLQTEGVAVGELFAWLSALYFRGKLRYANAFGAPPPGLPTALVITAGAGLWPIDQCVRPAHLRRFAQVEITADNAPFVAPLLSDLRALKRSLCNLPTTRLIFLGSIATDKYTRALREIFPRRIFYPAAFAGRGDMARGGLLLRAVRDRAELNYEPL